MRSKVRRREFRFFDRQPPVPDAREELVAGLTARAKAVSPKYFYDETGSQLFEAITKLPEYYLTRTETGILEDNRDDIAQWVGLDACLVEYGSGSSAKTRILLETCRPAAYVPVDISRGQLLSSAREIYEDFGDLAVYPTCADYSRSFELPSIATGLRKVGFFPGSTIGNIEPAEVPDFLRGVGRVIGPGGRFIVGVDTKKAESMLNAAYNDAAGVTRAFNLNILRHINAIAGADFDMTKFEHEAHYNGERGRVEMYLTSAERQTVRVNGAFIEFGRGERIHTEHSYKYDADGFAILAEQAGLRWLEARRDESCHFMVVLLENAGD